MTPDTSEEARLRSELGQVFSPAAPIDGKDLFAGRASQLRTVTDAVSQRGQHVLVFGERGVGKTSLSNVLPDFLQATGAAVVAPHVNCDSADNFQTLWRKIFGRVNVSLQERTMGLRPEVRTSQRSIAESLPEELTPDSVAQVLTDLGRQCVLIVIIDEFDRLSDAGTRRLFADTIKTLSDQSVPATLILVGVADNVHELIAEHQSIERALVQVPMPRMAPAEVREIILNRLPRFGMSIAPEALEQIVALARGLPHYAHLLGLYAARRALATSHPEILPVHVQEAAKEAIAGTNQSILALYHKATSSPRRDALYVQVALACALADADDLGYFAAKDVREPLNRILMDKSYDIPAFTRQLHDLCEADRGPLLQRTGPKHRSRFRFINPLLQPFIIMKGLVTGMISHDVE